jgi:Chloride channel protein EriC
MFTKPQNLLIYALLGVVCGLTGRLYTTSFYYFKSLFNRINTSKLVKPALGALLAGIIGVFFPEVLGLGYGFLQYLDTGRLQSPAHKLCHPTTHSHPHLSSLPKDPRNIPNSGLRRLSGGVRTFTSHRGVHRRHPSGWP